MRKSPADLEALSRKYRALLDLRRSREAYEAQGVYALTGSARAQRTKVARRLAREFPGALRELEHLDARAVQARLAAVETARRGGRAAPWIPVVLDFHRRLRLCLAIKRWLSRHRIKNRSLEEDELAAFRRWYGRQRDREARPVDVAFVGRFVSPPYGRLQELVWSDLARAHGLTVAETRKWVLGT
jgi:hypothetical protein